MKSFKAQRLCKGIKCWALHWKEKSKQKGMSKLKQKDKSHRGKGKNNGYINIQNSSMSKYHTQKI